MGTLQQELNALRRMIPPTHNVETDAFGAFRDWGSRTWHPGAEYAPIHTGRDYAVHPDHIIRMPLDGTHWGDWRPHPVGSYVMILPSIEGSPAQHSAIYLIHCEPTNPQWAYLNQGAFLTDHAGYGVGAPHVHVEVAVTPELGELLNGAGLLDMTPIGEGHWLARARAAALEVNEVLEELGAQIDTWSIEQITRDVIVRGVYPEYRLSKHSKLGAPVWILDPEALYGGAKEYSAA